MIIGVEEGKMAEAKGTDEREGSDGEFDGLRIEGATAVREIAFAVEYAELSKTLPATDQRVYINVKTKENETFCVELCLQGFRVSAVFRCCCRHHHNYHDVIVVVSDFIVSTKRLSDSHEIGWLVLVMIWVEV